MQQDSYNIISKLIDLIDNSKSGFKNTKMVDSEMALGLLNDLQLRIQEDYSQCQKIVTEREAILDNARKMAAGIEQDARERARQMTEENAITISARRLAQDIEDQANNEAAMIVNEAKAQAEAIRKDNEQDCENKKAATRTYINTRLEVADEMLDNARNALNASCAEINERLDDIRKLYSNLTSMDAPSFMNANNG